MTIQQEKEFALTLVKIFQLLKNKQSLGDLATLRDRFFIITTENHRGILLELICEAERQLNIPENLTLRNI